MFCKYCGQPTENENAVCDACAKTEEVEAATPAPVVYDKKFGFKGALTSTILGAIGYAVGVIFLEICAASLEFESVASIVTAILGIGACIPLGVLGLKRGIRAIRDFKLAKQNGVKPVATLILGIVGTAHAALSLFFASVFPILFVVAVALA